MNVFCDESGGVDPANGVFLVAAVAIPALGATRLLKTFRRAVDWKGAEVKGHALRRDQRRIFFDLVGGTASFASIVTSCHRCDVLGGWAMSALPEITLYSAMLYETCRDVASSTLGPLTITVDGGRYRRADTRKLEADLVHAAEGWSNDRCRTTVAFRDSASTPGLQIADVIANTAFQGLGDVPGCLHAESLLRPLQVSGSLVMREVVLADHRPAWLPP